jgi:hypothetical protein
MYRAYVQPLISLSLYQITILPFIWGTRYRSWLRHYATSRKVAGSITDVTEFFSWPNPSSRTMALRSTQPLTEMSTRNLPGGKARPARKAEKLTAICEPIFYKMWEPRRFTTLWASTTCYRDNFTYFLHVLIFLLPSQIGFSGLLPFWINLTDCR